MFGKQIGAISAYMLDAAGALNSKILGSIKLFERPCGTPKKDPTGKARACTAQVGEFTNDIPAYREPRSI